jgi:hypothetical protein
MGHDWSREKAECADINDWDDDEDCYSPDEEEDEEEISQVEEDRRDNPIGI